MDSTATGALKAARRSLACPLHLPASSREKTDPRRTEALGQEGAPDGNARESFADRGRVAASFAGKAGKIGAAAPWPGRPPLPRPDDARRGSGGPTAERSR